MFYCYITRFFRLNKNDILKNEEECFMFLFYNFYIPLEFGNSLVMDYYKG